ncbi:TPA: hypothetical protein I8Y21_005855 [Klebsiella oxytoca]|uniref:Uncharacterized protein n=1 Tax=Klebsiella oxytoca TaxID=571 RepID=A0AAN5LDY9_KLEOX|nr:hypothetical protein [Klebsiella oxytoca]
MSDFSDAVICLGADVIPWTDKKTGEPRVMCRANTLADYESDDRSVGFGFIAEELPEDNNCELARRLQNEYKLARSKGYDFLYIIPHFKRSARGRGEGKSVMGRFEVVGYGNFNRSPLDAKQPAADVKQPVKA